jgi:hypothetical protein
MSGYTFGDLLYMLVAYIMVWALAMGKILPGNGGKPTSYIEPRHAEVKTCY